MPRIVLRYPVFRHYAGSVFDLEENTGFHPADDPRVYDRLPPRRTYHLPDTGKGEPASLPLSDTVICPAAVWEGVDLRSGPCRITSAHTAVPEGRSFPFEAQLTLDRVTLTDDKQGVSIPFLYAVHPDRVRITDRTTGAIAGEYRTDPTAMVLEMDALLPGFYEIALWQGGERLHRITLIKCFPLVVTPDRYGNTFSVVATVW